MGVRCFERTPTGEKEVIAINGAVYFGMTGVNDSGQVVGFYADSSWNYHSFVYFNRTVTTISYPGYVTYLQGIANNGRIVGQALGTGTSFGFTYLDPALFADIGDQIASATFEHSFMAFEMPVFG